MKKLKRVVMLIMSVITMCAACLFTFGCNGGEKYTLEFYLYDYEKYGEYNRSEKENYYQDFKLLTSVKTTAPRRGTYHKVIYKDDLKVPYDGIEYGIYIRWAEYPYAYEELCNRYFYNLHFLNPDGTLREGTLGQKGRFSFQYIFALNGKPWSIHYCFYFDIE